MEKFRSILNLFLNGKTGSMVYTSSLVFVSVENALIIREFSEASGIYQHVMAFKVDGKIIGNSSSLRLNGRETSSDLPESVIISFQDLMSEYIPMIPFMALKQAELKLSEYLELDKTEAETIKIKKEFSVNESQFEKLRLNLKNEILETEKYESWNGSKMVRGNYLEARHFTGARLFQCGSKIFLMDIDRNEIQHGIFNPFLVEIPKPVKTVSEAYEALKPDKVISAEIQGVKVLRQGEWFLIPVYETPDESDEVTQGVLRVGRNRPNMTTNFFKRGDENFVSGIMSHTGREHKDLDLGDRWFLAIPNTSSNSFQISGDID